MNWKEKFKENMKEIARLARENVDLVTEGIKPKTAEEKIADLKANIENLSKEEIAQRLEDIYNNTDDQSLWEKSLDELKKLSSYIDDKVETIKNNEDVREFINSVESTVDKLKKKLFK